MVDDFSNTRFHSDANWLIAAGTAKTPMDAQSFPGQYGTPGSVGPEGTGFNVMPSSGTLTGGQWYYTKYGTTAQPKYDYTYVFAQDELNALATYINNNGDIAFGFDPDCHYYNEGIAFNVFTSPATVVNPSAVPEPASLFLLGSGLIAAAKVRSKRRSAKRQE